MTKTLTRASAVLTTSDQQQDSVADVQERNVVTPPPAKKKQKLNPLPTPANKKPTLNFSKRPTKVESKDKKFVTDLMNNRTMKGDKATIRGYLLPMTIKTELGITILIMIPISQANARNRCYLEKHIEFLCNNIQNPDEVVIDDISIIVAKEMVPMGKEDKEQITRPRSKEGGNAFVFVASYTNGNANAITITKSIADRLTQMYENIQERYENAATIKHTTEPWDLTNTFEAIDFLEAKVIWDIVDSHISFVENNWSLDELKKFDLVEDTLKALFGNNENRIASSFEAYVNAGLTPNEE
jgi:hypothetical protein